MENGLGYKVILASLPEYDEVVAEIYIGEKFAALISQESDNDEFLLEMPGPELVESEITRKVELSSFVKAIELGCERLRRNKQSS